MEQERAMDKVSMIDREMALDKKDWAMDTHGGPTTETN